MADSMSKRRRTGKGPASSSNNLEFYEKYLVHEDLLPRYRELCHLKHFPGKYVKFDDFVHFNLETVFRTVNMVDFLSTKHEFPYYPHLVHLFYANLRLESPHSRSRTIVSQVKDTRIKFTADKLSDILGLPRGDKLLMDVIYDNPAIEALLVLPDESLPLTGKNASNLAKLVGRIICYNIIPKTGAYSHYSHDLTRAIYAIIGNVDVHWGKVIFDILASDPSIFIPFGALLTKVFLHFGVDLTNEIHLPVRPFFDRSVLRRMELPTSFHDLRDPSVRDPDLFDSDRESPPSHSPRTESSHRSSSHFEDLLARMESYHAEAEFWHHQDQARFDSLEESHMDLRSRLDMLNDSHTDLRMRFSEIESTQSAIVKSQEAIRKELGGIRTHQHTDLEIITHRFDDLFRAVQHPPPGPGPSAP